MEKEEKIKTYLTMLEEYLDPSFRGRLLSRGLARSMIWKDGELPEDSPTFADSLTEDLLEYGFSLFKISMNLISLGDFSELTQRSLLIAGEAIESVVKRGEKEDPNRGLNIVSAATSYSLAGYAARSYCLVKEGLLRGNFSLIERGIAFLFLRDISGLREWLEEQLTSYKFQDVSIKNNFEKEGGLSELEAIIHCLEGNALSAMSLFEQALKTGNYSSIMGAIEKLDIGSGITKDLCIIPLWWSYKLLRDLFIYIWNCSMHLMIPVDQNRNVFESNGIFTKKDWNQNRELFISSLYMRKTSEIDLWPSQMEAAKRCYDIEDNLVVTLPTSAGKTRIAELCILRTISFGQRVIYLTPLRALSAQTERTLKKTFSPLGYTVSSLYGSSGATLFDTDSLKNRNIVVSTPEKLDFALRNDPDLINDVGLIVLDEGHLIGLGEREIRYEVLIQKLLSRDDSNSRRLVCLSAMLPDGDQLDDMVNWMRKDKDGGPIKSNWRPTRQRFGTLDWKGNYTRLELSISGEMPWVEKFLIDEPAKNRRKNSFPQNSNELVIGSSWQFAREGQKVLIYCPLRSSVEVLGELALKLNTQNYIESFLEKESLIDDVVKIGSEWLGREHVAVKCLKIGLVLHHGQLPRPFLQAVERLIEQGICKIIIASPTLAQGLNLSVGVLIINSLYRNKEFVPVDEFTNVIGRAGRAYVDIDGLILYPIHEKKRRDANYQHRKWGEMLKGLSKRELKSGLLLLITKIIAMISTRFEEDPSAVQDYILNNTNPWKFPIRGLEEHEKEKEEKKWKQYLSMLDSAILSLVLDLDCDASVLAGELDNVLNGSLWQRQLLKESDEYIKTYETLLSSRASWTWELTTSDERKGYYYAGIGIECGKYIDEHAELLEYLTKSETLIEAGDIDDFINEIIKFASIVFKVDPFIPYDLCDNWKSALRVWLRGGQMSDVVEVAGTESISFIQDGVVYKLVWALEAVRVRYDSVANEEDKLNMKGLTALACETGASNISACLLIQSGFNSRMGAIEAVNSENLAFTDKDGLNDWLMSAKVQELSKKDDWPTVTSSSEWKRYYYGTERIGQSLLESSVYEYECEWYKDTEKPKEGEVLRVSQRGEEAFILSADFRILGRIKKWEPVSNEANIWCYLKGVSSIELRYIGPNKFYNVFNKE